MVLVVIKIIVVLLITTVLIIKVILIIKKNDDSKEEIYNKMNINIQQRANTTKYCHNIKITKKQYKQY